MNSLNNQEIIDLKFEAFCIYIKDMLIDGEMSPKCALNLLEIFKQTDDYDHKFVENAVFDSLIVEIEKMSA